MTQRTVNLARRHPTAILFFTCVLAVIGVLGWLTNSVLDLEERESRARAESEAAETIRTALWRLDSALTPLLTQEAARPYFHYTPFYPAERAYNRLLQPVRDGEVLVPSPLLTSEPRFVRLHFQFTPAGEVTSPRVPMGNLRDLAESQYVPASEVIAAEAMLAKVISGREALVAVMSQQQAIMSKVMQESNWSNLAMPRDSMWQSETPAQSIADNSQIGVQQQRSYIEQKQRFEVASDAVKAGEAELSKNPKMAARGEGAKGALEKGEMKTSQQPFSTAAPAEFCSEMAMRLTPVWVSLNPPAQIAVQNESETPPSDQPTSPEAPLELVLVRTIMLDDGQSIVQGAWLDWPSLQESLLARIADLVPGAALRPAKVDELLEADSTLASIPAVLESGEQGDPGLASAWPRLGWTPTRLTLIVAWSSLLGAVAAIGLALRQSTELGTRRGRFVSAVTHELRTPLTTFCMYSQMLADGMITDSEARQEYLSTLKRESERLSRIVENVLCYARLADLRAGVHTERADAADVLDRIVPRLQTRASEADMLLTIDTAPVRGRSVDVDVQTLERILVNLVDNACKYAAESIDRRIHLEARIREGRGENGRGMIEVLVSDHGPGIPRRDWKRIFRAFERAEAGERPEHAAKPGLGLGLSLARGLAEEQGGDLRLLAREGFGAVFAVGVPIAA